MAEIPLVIEERPRGVRGRIRHALKGRRVLLGALLALAEIVAYIVWRPSVVLAMAAAFIVLVVAVSIATRIKGGLGRDLLWIVAGAQALVVAVPLLVGASLFLGVVLAGVIIVALVFVAIRMRI